MLPRRKALEIRSAHSGTPIALLSVDLATRVGSCSTSSEILGLSEALFYIDISRRKKRISIVTGFLEHIPRNYFIFWLGAVGIDTTTLNKQISALNPIDMLNNEERSSTCKFARAIYNLVKAHSCCDLKLGAGPATTLLSIVSILWFDKLIIANLLRRASRSPLKYSGLEHDILHGRKLYRARSP